MVMYYFQCCSCFYCCCYCCYCWPKYIFFYLLFFLYVHFLFLQLLLLLLLVISPLLALLTSVLFVFLRYAVEEDLYWTSRFINHRQHGTNANDDLIKVVSTHFDIDSEVQLFTYRRTYT